MAVALVQHKVQGVNDAGATTVAVTVTATGNGNLLVALTACNNKALTVTGVSDGTNAFTQFPSAAFNSGAAIQSWAGDCWYLPNSTTGKTTITATFSGSATIREIFVFEVSGFILLARDGVATNATTQTGAGTDDAGPAFVTTSVKGFVIGFVIVNNVISVNPKAGNAFTSGGDIDATLGDAACSLISVTASSKQPVWTDGGSGQVYQAMTVAFKEGGGGTSGPYRDLRLERPRPAPFRPGIAR